MCTVRSLCVLLLYCTARLAPAEETGAVQCSFQANPDEFLSVQSRARRQIEDWVPMIDRAGFRTTALTPGTPAAPLPRRNFIDDEIFARLDSVRVQPAPLSNDTEFLRRVYLDLAGRIPSATEIREFLADQNPNKREAVIDRLIDSPEFADKWAVWLADLTQNTESLSTAARQRQIEGRNAYDRFLRESLRNRKSLRDIAWESIAMSGNNYRVGPVNFAVSFSAAMGPIQDTFDLALAKTATAFLGLSHYDCLLCHNGRGHLDNLSLWAARATRAEAQKMAAFFSRMRLNGEPGTRQYIDELYNSTNVDDVMAGAYELNTRAGNRPDRLPYVLAGSLIQRYTPEYRDGWTPSNSENWRWAFATKVVDDPLFAINFVNRIWKQLFSLGLAEPVDQLDPARLDPDNPPPAPWTLQASHPNLLRLLAQVARNEGMVLQEIVRLIAKSTTYQLSSRYPGAWKVEYIPLFARHYPRRLTAEEIHDAIVKATGIKARYTYPVRNGQTIERGAPLPQSDPVEWAMQLPDVNEPRNNGAVMNLLNAFLRGNRDTAPRSQAGSLLQQLYLMNDSFITTRVRIANSPILKEIAADLNNSNAIENIFLTFLSRYPSDRERAAAVAHFNKGLPRNTVIEDLAWACINKVDFLFSY